MDQLPNEILIRILGYLDTYDLLQFCEVFRNLDYFLREKDLISYSKWSRRFEIQYMNLCQCILTKIDGDLIRILKINGIYWIPALDLRRLLNKLTNLEELHAIDTKISLKHRDILHYKKLKKLSVTIDDQIGNTTSIASNSLDLLKSLYLKIICIKEFDLASLLSKINNLDELWLQDDYNNSIRLAYLFRTKFKKLRKFVLRSTMFLPMNYSISEFVKTFESKRCTSETGLILEKIEQKKITSQKSIFDPKDNPLEKAWDVFESLNADKPCGPNEHKRLALGESISNIQFEELHFCHTPLFCNSRYVFAALEILKSENCKNLKKLSLRSCLFQNFNRVEELVEDIRGFKRNRVGVRVDDIKHSFEDIVPNLKNLIEFEIYNCAGCNISEVIAAYPLIANFKKLQKLNLQVPLLPNGKYLEKVFNNCKELEYLSIDASNQNETFLAYLYRYLHCATSIKDFRLTCKSVNVEKLFTALCQLPTRNLYRVYLDCNTFIHSSAVTEKELFSSFFKKHLQLILFLLITSKSTAKQVSTVQRILLEHKNGNVAKIFICRKDIENLESSVPIPYAHWDIMSNRSKIAMINFDIF